MGKRRKKLVDGTKNNIDWKWELVVVKTDNIKQQGEIDMLRQDHLNKINGLDNKIDELKEIDLKMT